MNALEKELRGIEAHMYLWSAKREALSARMQADYIADWIKESKDYGADLMAKIRSSEATQAANRLEYLVNEIEETDTVPYGLFCIATGSPCDQSKRESCNIERRPDSVERLRGLIKSVRAAAERALAASKMAEEMLAAHPELRKPYTGPRCYPGKD